MPRGQFSRKSDISDGSVNCESNNVHHHGLSHLVGLKRSSLLLVLRLVIGVLIIGLCLTLVWSVILEARWSALGRLASCYTRVVCRVVHISVDLCTPGF